MFSREVYIHRRRSMENEGRKDKSKPRGLSSATWEAKKVDATSPIANAERE